MSYTLLGSKHRGRQNLPWWETNKTTRKLAHTSEASKLAIILTSCSAELVSSWIKQSRNHLKIKNNS
jgi:hypothetical protein